MYSDLTSAYDAEGRNREAPGTVRIAEHDNLQRQHQLHPDLQLQLHVHHRSYIAQLAKLPRITTGTMRTVSWSALYTYTGLVWCCLAVWLLNKKVGYV